MWNGAVHGKFLPDLATDLEPIRALTRKDTEWNWSTVCDKALETVKQQLSDTPVLAYFDSNKDVKLQEDSSKDGWHWSCSAAGWETCRVRISNTHCY